MQDEILEFIHRRWNKDSDWLNGNCYWFSFILSTRFPELKIYYEPIAGHFVAGCANKFYDWTGNYMSDAELILLDDIKKEDVIWYERLIRDCMM